MERTAAPSSRPASATYEALGTDLTSERGQDSLLSFVNTVLRSRRLIVGCAILGFVLVAAVKLLSSARYTTTVAFAPVSSLSSTNSALSSVAAEFGFALPSGSAGSLSSDFFADLISQSQFLQPLVEATYTIGDSAGRSYAAIRGISGDRREQVIDASITDLANCLTISNNSATGIVSVVVRTQSPEFSQQIGAKLLAAVDSFASRLRTQKAEADHRFFQERLDSSRAELASAENAVQRFLQTNREYATDPELLFEHDRLVREMSVRQTVYTTLRQGLEQSRIEAGRNTPTITVVQDAQPALVADKRHLLTALLAALIVGALLGAGIGFTRDYLARASESDPKHYREFTELRTAIRGDLRRVISVMRRSGAGRR